MDLASIFFHYRFSRENYGRINAKAVAFEHPHTARALNEIADDYERQAKREDEDAERRDWSY